MIVFIVVFGERNSFCGCERIKGPVYHQAPCLFCCGIFVLVSSVSAIALPAHHILVEHGKSDKKGNTDQVFNGLDILIEIHHGVHGFDVTYGIEYI
jgi:hypothetical protein